ncbi:MAG: hypothetical protein DRR16_29715 [Candidatus Parabeggiatoa sp. nov. 3]|nr:MAG: hypothetical protein DRR00_30485 [Gammaproteobacteria bacterium]RKZ55817.1 MAG: hypothetical protein DRQ99_29495 [Gammaproteobacteria bacterium]RKZ77364.1 MAG: hypothetical protein DRR16_29715 [Gammaproteobacteria bacterium]HEW98312.1 hypothetical protein [Beggiatoa sp.]
MCLRLVAVIIVAVIFIAVTFGEAYARNYPVPFPYMTDGLDELKTLIVEMKRHIPISSQEIDLDLGLGRGIKVVGFFHSYGSGIETINAYIYMCETGNCQLFVFCQTWKSQVTLDILKKTKEMILKSDDGTIVFRMPFPYVR